MIHRHSVLLAARYRPHVCRAALLSLYGLTCISLGCSRAESKSNVDQLRSLGQTGTTSVLPVSARANAHPPTPEASMSSARPPSTGSSGPNLYVPPAVAKLLEQARKGGKSNVAYVTPTDAELETYERFVEQLQRTAGTERAGPTAIPLGFRIETPESGYRVLVEEHEQKRGAAVVVIRDAAASEVAIEVPHSFHDESTLPIGLALFEATNAKVLIVNTVHRYSARQTGADRDPDEAEPREDSPSDVAHVPRSFFQAAHQAFVHGFPRGLVIQLHGFRDSNAAGRDVVLSAARTTTNVQPFAEALGRALSLRVAVYPKDTSQLGGTKNVQAAFCRAQQHRFLHVELSASLRKRLMEGSGLLNRFASAIAGEAR